MPVASELVVQATIAVDDVGAKFTEPPTDRLIELIVKVAVCELPGVTTTLVVPVDRFSAPKPSHELAPLFPNRLIVPPLLVMGIVPARRTALTTVLSKLKDEPPPSVMLDADVKAP